MKNYRYSYKPYQPPSASNNYWFEGCYWKSQSQWKKNRPICGARCRDGHACKAKAVVDPQTDKPLNGRCRMHGGLSCGPVTAEGKEKSREAARQGMLKYWQRKKS